MGASVSSLQPPLPDTPDASNPPQPPIADHANSRKSNSGSNDGSGKTRSRGKSVGRKKRIGDGTSKKKVRRGERPRVPGTRRSARFIEAAAAAAATATATAAGSNIKNAKGNAETEANKKKRKRRATMSCGKAYSLTAGPIPTRRSSSIRCRRRCRRRVSISSTTATTSSIIGGGGCGGGDPSTPLPLPSSASSLTPSASDDKTGQEKKIGVVTLNVLPLETLLKIGAFAGECFPLSNTCKSNLDVTHELHFKISMKDSALGVSSLKDPSERLSCGQMGAQNFPGRALPSGRVVTRITVNDCTDPRDKAGGYEVLETAVKKVVRHSIHTLRSITVRGMRGKDSARVAAILCELVPSSSKNYRKAPRLTHVELHHSAAAFSKAGKAIAAGLWPALEELLLPNCHANLTHIGKLVSGLGCGRAPNLRLLDWDEQASNHHKRLDDAILSALSKGECPHLEFLSFANAKAINPSISDDSQHLKGALRACPLLKELRMTVTRRSTEDLTRLTEALEAGDVPCLAYLEVSCLRRHSTALSAPEMLAIKRAATARIPAVRFNPQWLGWRGDAA